MVDAVVDKQVVSDLQKLQALFATPDNWMQGRYHKIDPYTGQHRFCLSGGANKFQCVRATVHLIYQTALEKFGLPTAAVNDRLGYEAVVLLLDIALDIAEAELADG